MLKLDQAKNKIFGRKKKTNLKKKNEKIYYFFEAFIKENLRIFKLFSSKRMRII